MIENLDICSETYSKTSSIMINWGKMDERINCFTILMDFKVKMGASGVSCATRERNDLRFSHKLASLNKQVIAVRIKSNEAISMVQAYSLPVSSFPS
jgi:hypothetical protein